MIRLRIEMVLLSVTTIEESIINRRNKRLLHFGKSSPIMLTVLVNVVLQSLIVAVGTLELLFREFLTCKINRLLNISYSLYCTE